MAELPAGTVTLLFTDIEGSTRLLHLLGERYGGVLAIHQGLLRAAFHAHGGVEVDTQGDAFLVAFATAPDAVAAAVDAQRVLASHPWPDDAEVRVRMGLHTGAPSLRADGAGYVGVDVHRAARIAAAGHGGQVLLSAATLALANQALPESASVRDLGAHPNNLPVQATPLIGREREVMAVTETLLIPEVRLVTLTGPGGTGKTRLALAAAADMLSDFSDGVWFVPLAALTNPALVASAIAGALHVREAGGVSLTETLAAYLRDKEALLVLDNFEQVVEAAPLVGALLAACPALKALVTSRSSLRVYGEREHPVPPLALPHPASLPSLAALTQYEAVRLFIARAQAVKRDFVVSNANAPAVAEICHRLDGLPLAIELAAARVRLLPPEALLARLESRLKLLTGGTRDVPARQRTLRGAIDWSHDLLDEGEKILFRRLAVFAGGGTLEAIAAVCDAEGDLPVDVLDGVESLVSKSLLRQEEGGEREPRFGMLETIREFALVELQKSGEAEQTRQAHTDYFTSFVEQGGRSEFSHRAVAWEREHDNLRAALAWALGRDKTAVALRLTARLWFLWYTRGQFDEGRRWLEAVIERVGPTVTPDRVKTINRLSELARFQGDFARARALKEENLLQVRTLGMSDWLLVGILTDLSKLVAIDGEYERARSLAEEGLERQRRLGGNGTIVHALNGLGRVAFLAGDYAAAQARYEESLSLARREQFDEGVAYNLYNLGDTLRSMGRVDEAHARYRECLPLGAALGDKVVIAACLEGLAAIAGAAGRIDRAARLWGAASAVRGDTTYLAPSERADHEIQVAAARAQLDPAMWDAAWAAGQALTLDEVMAYALDDTSA